MEGDRTAAARRRQRANRFRMALARTLARDQLLRCARCQRWFKPFASFPLVVPDFPRCLCMRCAPTQPLLRLDVDDLLPLRHLLAQYDARARDGVVLCFDGIVRMTWLSNLTKHSKMK